MKINKNERSVGRRHCDLLSMVCLLIVLSGTVARAGEKKSITIKGSDTMVHLVSNWAEAFMKQDPNVEVAVTGGGSGTGIAALINGTTEICASSREMKEKEKQQAKEKGIEPKEVVVARDGIAVVVNPKNPVKELDMQQLAQIFTGAYTRWNQVGGGDKEILVFSRESSSGTYAFFQEHVLKNKDYTPKAKTDASDIGYYRVGFGG